MPFQSDVKQEVIQSPSSSGDKKYQLPSPVPAPVINSFKTTEASRSQTSVPPAPDPPQISSTSTSSAPGPMPTQTALVNSVAYEYPKPVLNTENIKRSYDNNDHAEGSGSIGNGGKRMRPQPQKVTPKSGPFGKFWIKLRNMTDRTEFGIRDKFQGTRESPNVLYFIGGSFKRDQYLYLVYNNLAETQRVLNQFKDIEEMSTVDWVPSGILKDFKAQEATQQDDSKDNRPLVAQRNIFSNSGRGNLGLGERQGGLFQRPEIEANSFSNRSEFQRNSVVGRLKLFNFPAHFTRLDFIRCVKQRNFFHFSQNSLTLLGIGGCVIDFTSENELRRAVREFNDLNVDGCSVNAEVLEFR